MAARPSLMPSSREPLCMEFLGLTYTVQAADGSGKTILADASGVVNPGDVLAIMGPSGAGKTTLLSLLAGRQRPTQGCVLLNRRPLDKATRRAISVVTQNDVLFQHLTVRETLTYSALLRLPSAMTRAEKLQRVDHVIDALRLTKVRDSIVGNQFVRGISGGEKRRVSIGVELLSNPGILLLDEPTTGLDSSTALSLVETLKSIAISDDVAVALTIHQPGTNIFMKFDSLMLVAHGRLAYFGSRTDSVEFFQRAGHPVPNNYNPADYYMDVLNEPSKRDQILAYAQRELPAPIACSVCTHPAAYPTANLPGQNNQQQTPPMICSRCVSQAGAPSPASSQRSLNEEDDEERTWPTTSLQQIMILAHRSFTQTKGEIVSLLPWLQTCVVLLVVSLVWNQMSYTEAQIQDRRGFIFFMCAYWGFQMMSLAASTFPIDRAVLQKERLSGSYRLSSYVIAKSISELPLVLIQPTVFHAICYWATGLRGGVYYVISWAIHMLLCLAAHSIGLFIGASIMDFKKAVTVASSSMMFCMLTGGFYAQQFPSWIKWIQWTSFVKYGYDAQVYNEFHGKTFSCLTPSSQYEACNSQSFLEGEDVLEKYNTETRLWLLLVVLALFTFFFRFLAYLSLRTLHSTSRGIQKGPKPKSFAASRAGSRRESAIAKV